jgi:RHS repeat-associated protein
MRPALEPRPRNRIRWLKRLTVTPKLPGLTRFSVTRSLHHARRRPPGRQVPGQPSTKRRCDKDEVIAVFDQQAEGYDAQWERMVARPLDASPASAMVRKPAVASMSVRSGPTRAGSARHALRARHNCFALLGLPSSSGFSSTRYTVSPALRMPYCSWGESGTDERFTGHEFDDETNLYHMIARMYMPELGRFMRPDPLASEYPGWTPYHYVLNNPITNIDPSGEYVLHSKVNQDGKRQFYFSRVTIGTSQILSAIEYIPGAGAFNIFARGTANDPSFQNRPSDYVFAAFGELLKVQGPSLINTEVSLPLLLLNKKQISVLPNSLISGSIQNSMHDYHLVFLLMVK